MSRFFRDRDASLSDQLHGVFVHGQKRPFRIIRPVIQIQKILHARQARAIKRASFSPSRIGPMGGRSRFFRSRAASSPWSTKRLRIPSAGPAPPRPGRRPPEPGRGRFHPWLPAQEREPLPGERSAAVPALWPPWQHRALPGRMSSPVARVGSQVSGSDPPEFYYAITRHGHPLPLGRGDRRNVR